MSGIHSLICLSTILCDSTRKLIPLKNHQSKTLKTLNKGSDLNQSNEVVRNLVLGFVHHGITLKDCWITILKSLPPKKLPARVADRYAFFKTFRGTAQIMQNNS